MKYNHNRLRNNILRMYKRVHEDTHEEGFYWYNMAHEWCRDVSIEYNLPLETVCGVVSALSPGVSWPQNQKDTISVIRKHLGLQSVAVVGTYPVGLRKAEALLGGALQEDVFRPSAPKTRSFYFNILNPHDPEHVCIDRHAVKVARGMKKGGALSITPHQYNKVKEAYKEAASILGLIPARLQAIVWLQYKIENER